MLILLCTTARRGLQCSVRLPVQISCLNIISAGSVFLAKGEFPLLRSDPAGGIHTVLQNPTYCIYLRRCFQVIMIVRSISTRCYPHLYCCCVTMVHMMQPNHIGRVLGCNSNAGFCSSSHGCSFTSSRLDHALQRPIEISFLSYRRIMPRIGWCPSLLYRASVTGFGVHGVRSGVEPDALLFGRFVVQATGCCWLFAVKMLQPPAIKVVCYKTAVSR